MLLGIKKAIFWIGVVMLTIIGELWLFISVPVAIIGRNFASFASDFAIITATAMVLGIAFIWIGRKVK